MNGRRLGIFAFYEKNGIVEEYVLYLLADLKKCLERLVIVCNGNLSEEGRQKLEEYSEDIYIRNNKGYDIGAFRYILIDCLGQRQVQEYDELVLCNDTFFGPFISFEDIFRIMNEKKLDFWGLSSQPETIDFWTSSNRIVPAFIQSFFIVIKKRLIKAPVFWDYWDKMQVEQWNVTQVVINHEQYFTPYFETLGYTWGTFTECSFFKGKLESNAYTPYLVLPYELIKYGKAPFLKKKCITGKDISQSLEPENGSFRKAIDYIDQNTDYNVDLILNYMLNNCTKQQIFERLKLNYILSDEKEDNPHTEFGRIAIIIVVKDQSILQLMNYYLEGLPEEVLCIQDSHVKKAILKIPAEIEYICVLQEVGNQKNIPKCTAISANRLLCENMIFNAIYVSNIIYSLQKDKYLGALLAPCMRFSVFLNEKENISDCLAGSFWGKRKAIEANMEGYYVGRVFRERCAGLEGINEDLLVKEMLTINEFENKITDFTSYFVQRLFAVCRGYQRIYLYGAGGVGQRTAQILQNENIAIEGFIVSDGQTKEKEILGYNVFCLSEVIEMNPDIQDIGVIIAVEGITGKVIQENLLKYGIKGYILWN